MPDPFTGPLGSPPNTLNPLLGWLGASGVNQQPLSALPTSSPIPSPGIGHSFGDPSGQPGWGQPRGMQRNAAFENIISGQLRNLLAPQFANRMMGYADPAAQFFSQLMNLGGPFYQQKQRQSFEQGVQQAQNAAGQARQQLGARGYGYTPSGAGAAMIGGMGQAAATSQAEQFLQNLFQNEQLQTQGAQGMAQLASLFNPAQMLGGNVAQPQFNPGAFSSVVIPLLNTLGGGNMIKTLFG